MVDSPLYPLCAPRKCPLRHCVFLVHSQSVCLWAAGRAVGTVDGADREEGAQEGKGMARSYFVLVCMVPPQTKSRFRASDTDPTLVKSFLTVCSVLEMLMLLIIALVHLKNFYNAVIVLKQNVVGIIFLNVQKRLWVHLFAGSWLTCGSRQGGARSGQITLACALKDIPARSPGKCL